MTEQELEKQKSEKPAQRGALRQQDRRVRKTKAQLRRCLAALMKTKKINEITVKELTDLSDLNRGTFYLHYKDVFDLLEQTESELIEEFDQTLDRFDLSTFKKPPTALFEEIFTLVKENKDIVGVLIGDNGDLNFTMQMCTIVEKRCLKSMMGHVTIVNPEYAKLYTRFLLSGCIGIIQYWIRTDCAESPHKLAVTTEKIVTDGLRALE